GEQEVDVLADGNDGAGGHDHVVGERRLPEEVRVDLGAVHGDGRRAVGAPSAEVERVEPQAVAGRAGQAGAAPAAGGERQRDVVAGRDGGDVVADLLDDSGALVAEDGGRLEEGGELEVGGADADGAQPDQHLVGPRRAEVDVPQDQGFSRTLQYGGGHPHAASQGSFHKEIRHLDMRDSYGQGFPVCPHLISRPPGSSSMAPGFPPSTSENSPSWTRRTARLSARSRAAARPTWTPPWPRRGGPSRPGPRPRPPSAAPCWAAGQS